MPETLTFAEFAARYCERQEQTPAGLWSVLRGQQARYRPDGWLLLEAQDLSSSWLGSLTILPYGPGNTFTAPPDRPISPRGLASDMSVVVALLPADALPENQPDEPPPVPPFARPKSPRAAEGRTSR